MIPLPEYVADALAGRDVALAAHWRARAVAATPRRWPAVGGTPAPAPEAHAPALADAGAVPETMATESAEALVRALAASLRKDARPLGEVMRLGWRAGADAHSAGLSLRHVVRDADLLLAVLLTEVERIVAGRAETPGEEGAAAAAIAVARRLHQGAGGYLQAAVSGFVHAFLRALRERYRMLRHDLRNPLGTIQGALSLMDDESVPVETRHGPKMREMVARNAGSLDRLIAAGLDDAAAASLLAAPQQIALADVARAARREVREAARLVGCDVVVSVPEAATAQVDAAALELALTSLLLGAVALAGAGDTVAVSWCAPEAATPASTAGLPTAGTPVPAGAPTVTLRLSVDGGGVGAPGGGARWDEQGIALAASILADHGGRLTAEGLSPADPNAEQARTLARFAVLVLTLPERFPNLDPRVPRRRASDQYLTGERIRGT
ncbi:MAG TPA: histidine kinase dimerization/phospho-acceptor domain-containing protein [Gemmatirosa sp.]|nr:histidine kinase dimerization/phospho-acceptor domain-containing protein [Gemmatirosa sp.]